MTRNIDLTKTLDELDPPPWGDAEYQSSLVAACHRLRGKPIGEFSVEDLRIMIGQGIGLPFLIPLAVEALEQDPLAEGDSSPGDLLGSILGVEQGYWVREREWRDRVRALLDRLPELPEELVKPANAFRERTS
jgi:hypothetical protein